MNQLEVLKRKMMSAARKVNLDLLRDPAESDQKPSFDTEGIGDALFYIVQGGTNDFGRCAVTVGRYATELIYQAVFERGRCLKKLCRSLTVTQYFERRLEHLLGVMCFESLHTGQPVSGEQGGFDPKFKVIFLTGGEDGMGGGGVIGGDGEDGMGSDI